MSAIAERTKQLIAETLGVDEAKITPETDLRKDLGADSLDVVDTIVRLEKEFGATIPDEKMERMTRVQHFVEYFETIKQIPLHDLISAKAA